MLTAKWRIVTSLLRLSDLFPLRIDDDLELQVLQEHHAQSLFNLVDSSRQHLRVWLSFVDSYQSVSAASDFIQKFQQKLTIKDGMALGIWYKGNMAGVITYDRFDWPNRATLIGYWLGQLFQGKGLMSRTCTALVNVAFDKLGLNRVEIWCASENIRCCSVAERLGFTQEGILRQRERIYDHFVDITAFSMLASEWKRTRRTVSD